MLKGFEGDVRVMPMKSIVAHLLKRGTESGHFCHFCALLIVVFGLMSGATPAAPLLSSVRYSTFCGDDRVLDREFCLHSNQGTTVAAIVRQSGVEVSLGLLPSATAGGQAEARLSYSGAIYALDSGAIMSLLHAHPELAQVSIPVNVNWFTSVRGAIIDNERGFELSGRASLFVSYSWSPVITGGTVQSNQIIGSTDSVPISFADFGQEGFLGEFSVGHFAECDIDRFGPPPYGVLLGCWAISDPTFSLDQTAFDAQLSALGLGPLRLADLFSIGYSPGLSDLPVGVQSADLPGTGMLLLAGMLAFGFVMRKQMPLTRLAGT